MKVIFASCTDAQRVPEQVVWKEIQARSPDVLLLLGDQIYMDWGDLGESNLKKQLSKPKGLEAFAREMHRRYELQWSVASFQTCIHHLRANGKQLFLIWDDHDFAWNNSFRQGKQDEKHAVPLSVMHVSKRLFKQFEAHLQTRFDDTQYPIFPNDWNVSFPEDEPGIDTVTTLFAPNCSIDFHLLDTRWYKTSRADSSLTILGKTSVQTQQLLSASQQMLGLLIVAGGTPMKHDFVIANDAWVSDKKTEPDFPEYDALLQAAKRPVLYLAGDIHRNAFSGLLQRKNASGIGAQPSQVLQLLSSGAAISGYGPIRFEPCFGQLIIKNERDKSGEIDIELLCLDKGLWRESPPCPKLEFNSNGWKQTYAGEDFGDIPFVIDTQQLSTLTARTRTRDTAFFDDLARESLEAFDSGPLQVFQDSIRPDNYSDAAWIRSSAKPQVKLVRFNAITDSNSCDQNIRAVIKDAFDRATERRKKSVVFFIHGLGKTHAQALGQAYSIRSLYPDCEPIAFTWPAGTESNGFLSALNNYQTTLANAAGVALHLQHALTLFSDIGQHYLLKKVVLARSAGSIALNQAFAPDSVFLIKHLDSIILSAPLIKVSDFDRRFGFFKSSPCPVWVTSNSKDSVLSKAEWANWKLGDVLGHAGPIVKQNALFNYVDFSKAIAINRLHDYIFTPIENAQAVHAALLSGENKLTALLGKHLKTLPRSGTYEVL